MKLKLLILAALLAAACAAALHTPAPNPFVITIEAQALPLTRTFAWTDDAAADAATGHTVTLDGAVIGTPLAQSQPVVFATLGTHILTVTETNVWGTSAPTSLTVNVKAAAAPTALKLQ